MTFATILLALAVTGQAQAPPCQAATDPEYGLTALKAVRIGGGALYMAARERRYLDSLKGPAGETLTYKRTGSTVGEMRGSPVDVWEVTWPGAEKPVNLYLYAYMYGEPKVPAGFTCASFMLGMPPIDGFISRDQQNAVAVSQGATQDFAPISLDPDGSSTSGVVFDRFRVIARASRAAAAASTSIDPAKLPAQLAQAGLVVVVYPKQCAGKTAAPRSIEVVSTSAPPLKALLAPHTGDALKTLLFGFEAPAGSLGQTFAIETLRPNDHVRVIYDDVCEGPSRGGIFSVTRTGTKGIVMPEPTRPDGVAAPDEPVWLQAVVDLDGRLVNGQHVGGPGGALVEAALKTLLDWRAEPARINGSPVVADTHVVFRFKDR